MAALDGRKRKQWELRPGGASSENVNDPLRGLGLGTHARLRDLHLDPLRGVAAVAVYVTLLGAHPLVIGVSPLPQ